MPRAALLVSPAPLDAYPPVQNQARLLARAGFKVEVVTAAVPWKAGAPDFAEPGVAVHKVDSAGRGPFAAGARNLHYLAVIAAARRRLGGEELVEIAYDPVGMLLSDCAPHRPRLRVAHFHECLQRLDTTWLERRLRSAIAGYDRIVVADESRATILQDQLSLEHEPLVIPNYPMWSYPPPRRSGGPEFEVIYCGVVGMLQKLDVIIASVAHWPERAVFTIVGNDRTEIGTELKRIAATNGVQSRVNFAGWLPYDRLGQRLAQADVGILFLDPSYEQFRTALGASNKRYQYLQSGLPQIGDMNPGVAEFLEGQGIGRCVASFDPVELASVVAQYATQPELSAAQGRRAYELHQTRYNYENAFAPLLEWLLASVSRKGVAA